MTTISIVGGIALVLAGVVPIVARRRKGDRKRGKIEETIRHFAKERSAELHEVEVWNDSAIGIDQERRKIFYLQGAGSAPVYHHLDFHEIKGCTLVDARRRIADRDGGYQVIDRLALDFSFQEKSRPNISLEFYNIQRDHLTVQDEFQLAMKWHQKITALLQATGKGEKWHF